ncbi:hypothetical protein [Fibrobacter sp.]|uniref:hypothetical protein n=1 Tax=Fibrobacter sp. TaxID=35828 RepID=UPI002624F55B|nr:hypothetical protein [Fibrobacter sp.]MDD5942907.1 hypothetical protein [Fibrobacter sp.]
MTCIAMGFGGQVKRRSASRMDSVGLMTSRMTCFAMGFGGQLKRGSDSRMDSVGLTDLQNDMLRNGLRRPTETQE